MTFIRIKLLLVLQLTVSINSECSRSISRIVRNVFNEEVRPLFNDLQVSVPVSCPFSFQNDVYALQESNKFTDSPSRWTCGFCGKSFYDERYLDRHYDIRHSDKIPQSLVTICLADLCDIFRCEIITGRAKPHFWDLALCKESEMSRLTNKCQRLTSWCIPNIMEDSQKDLLAGRLNETLCSYLTCERFWETTDNEVPRRRTVLYIVFGVVLMFVLFVYYFVAYTHFYTDDSLFNGSRRRRRQERACKDNRRTAEHIRNRIISSERL